MSAGTSTPIVGALVRREATLLLVERLVAGWEVVPNERCVSGDAEARSVRVARP